MLPIFAIDGFLAAALSFLSAQFKKLVAMSRAFELFELSTNRRAIDN
jgi:hypothetical protein